MKVKTVWQEAYGNNEVDSRDRVLHAEKKRIMILREERVGGQAKLITDE